MQLYNWINFVEDGVVLLRNPFAWRAWLHKEDHSKSEAAIEGWASILGIYVLLFCICILYKNAFSGTYSRFIYFCLYKSSPAKYLSHFYYISDVNCYLVIDFKIALLWDKTCIFTSWTRFKFYTHLLVFRWKCYDLIWSPLVFVSLIPVSVF